MPRIRKQTSRRATTRDRAKITKKAHEQKRKNNKAAKKDVTWKSNKKKDPGVPNSFPFKDKVLAELAEEKRRTEEEKIARREAAKAPKPEEEEADTPGISSLSSSTAVHARTPLSGTSKLVESSSSTAGEADIPALIDTALPTLQEALDRADVVVEVVDARDIIGGRSGYLETLVNDAEGKIVLLVNKIDLVPQETLQTWLDRLTIPTFLFKSSFPAPQAAPSSSKAPAAPVPSIEPATTLGRTELLAAVKTWSAEKKSRGNDEPLVLALMGLPTVGKTSVLNSLLPGSQRRPVAPSVPTAQSAKHPEPITKAPVEVEIDVQGEKIKVIDTPGWEQVQDDDDEDEEEEEEDAEEEQEPDLAKFDALEAMLAGDLLRRNLGRVDRVKDVFPLINYVVKRSNYQDLMLAYNIPHFENGNVEAFLTGLARAQGRIKKHGTPDLESAARVVLRDWAHNAFPYYCTPPAASSTMEVESTTEKYDMSAVLERCRSKKDLKKESLKGLIRFKSGELDGRDIILDDDYTAMAGASDDEDQDEGEDDEDEDGEDEDAEEDEDEEEDDDDEEDGLVIGSDEGDELELEDGPEPSSGSDVEDADEDEEEEEEDEEDEESEPEPPKPQPQGKKRKARESIVAPTKKAKRVSFARENETRIIKGNPSPPTKGKANPRKRSRE